MIRKAAATVGTILLGLAVWGALPGAAGTALADDHMSPEVVTVGR
ncbi:hypothetical protein [Streptacidiphilus monticola]|jgi:hypothetical protein|uniref:Uncharacterized protein n=1 Tax=Streptacidiphilus monticola TaxID=2161674 RepID=A0ABW1FV01_9ACTN